MISYEVKQSSASYPLVFLMIDSSDHIAGKTGLSPTVTLSKNGGSFASPSGSVSEVGNGWYKVAGNSTDTNTLGPLALHATATGADTSDAIYPVVAVDPQSATAHITGVNGIAPPANWNLMSIDGSGRVDIGKILGTASAGAVGYVGVDWGQVTNKTTTNALTGTTIATTQQVDVNTIKTQAVTCAAGVTVNVNVGTTQPVNFTGTAGSALVKTDMVDIAGAAVSTSTAQLGVNAVNWGGSAVGSMPNSTTPPTAAAIATAVWTDTTAGDFTTTSSPGKILVAQLGGAFTTTSSSVYSTASLANAPTGGSAPSAAAIATAVWQDATAGDFTVSGSIGKSLFTSGAVPGAAGGLFIAGTNAATTVTTAFTATFTGNLTGSVGSVSGVTFPTNFSSLGIDSGGNVKIQGSIKKNTALGAFEFLMVLSSDHYTPATGKTVTAVRSIDGGATASCANSVAEVGLGLYKIDLAAADLNGNVITLEFSASACDTTYITITTQP